MAPAPLSGVVYYGSYSTQLVQNSMGAVGGNGNYGAAVLSVHPGDTAPALVAGSNGGVAQCRVCHSVAAGGSRLVVQHGDNYDESSEYDLTATTSTETVLANGIGWFPGVYPDGPLAFDDSGQLFPLPSDATIVTPTGLAQVSTDFGTPAFSPSGTLAAFDPSVSSTVTDVAQKLFVMGFAKSTSTFSNPVVVDDDSADPDPDVRPGWPAFLPDGSSIVFHHQTQASTDAAGEAQIITRAGARAQIYWTSVTDAEHVTPLDALNGRDSLGNVYLPSLPATTPATSCMSDSYQVGDITPDHSDDVDMNYEPTVSPVTAGGYAWVVFTSRRMYGSVATLPPYCSDPRGVESRREHHPQEALGRRRRRHGHARHRREPPGVLPARAGAARLQRAGRVGARSLTPTHAMSGREPGDVTSSRRAWGNGTRVGEACSRGAA